jgi:hypothetical protein
MSPGLAETVLLRCVTSNVNHLKPKRSWVVVDWARGEIKTENFSTDKPPKSMIFQIEEMNEAIIEGLKLGPRDESLLELSRITGHVIQSEDEQESTQYECAAP